MTSLIPFQIFKQLLATDFLLLMLILQEKCSEIKRNTLAMSLKGHTLAMALKGHTLAMALKGGMATNNGR